MSSALPFTKMQGAGNDFVVLDGLAGDLALSPERLRSIADRRRGVGCDQVLVVTPARDAAEHFAYRIFNADGSEAEQCGNGVRCVARWLADHGRIEGRKVRIGSRSGVVEVELLEDGRVRADMGVPELEPARIPFEAPQRQSSYALSVFGRNHEIGAVSMGNPHAVLRVPAIDAAPVAELGREIERHPRFPQRVNVGFMQVVDAERIRLRVHERGVGETLACGTGACAAVVWGRLAHGLAPRVTVELPGGSLVIEWPGAGEHALMTGPTATAFTGELQT